MGGVALCQGQIECISLLGILAILLIGLVVNYIFKYIIPFGRRAQNSSLPLHTVNNNTNILALSRRDSVHNSLYHQVLKSIPLVAYKTGTSSSSNNGGDDDRDTIMDFEQENCVICLGEFEQGETIRVLPRCKHIYHMECFDEWLLRSLYCPLCRMKVVADDQVLT